MINYWFYLISRGGAGVNDHGWAYNVTPLPSEFKAFKIIFFAIENYMIPYTSTFSEFRISTLEAEKQLFNVCPYQRTLKHAWYAVGVSTDTLVQQPCSAVDNAELANTLSIKVIKQGSKDYLLLTSMPIHGFIVNSIGLIINRFSCESYCKLEVPQTSGIYYLLLYDETTGTMKNFKIVLP